MEQRCPKCHGTICRLGNREKPFLCRTCKAWYSKDEVAVKSSRADKIRDMSDEELADFIARQRFSVVNPIADKYGIDLTPEFIVCRKIVLDLLKQEVESDV